METIPAESLSYHQIIESALANLRENHDAHKSILGNVGTDADSSKKVENPEVVYNLIQTAAKVALLESNRDDFDFVFVDTTGNSISFTWYTNNPPQVEDLRGQAEQHRWAISASPVDRYGNSWTFESSESIMGYRLTIDFDPTAQDAQLEN